MESRPIFSSSKATIANQKKRRKSRLTRNDTLMMKIAVGATKATIMTMLAANMTTTAMTNKTSSNKNKSYNETTIMVAEYNKILSLSRIKLR